MLQKNAAPIYLNKRRGRKSANINNDQTIQLRNMDSTLRLVEYTDPETGKAYQYLTNAEHLTAKTIADFYKERWKIELFFKWIKQNLKIKTFYGTSANAVLTQIWIVLCVYLLLSIIKFKARLGISITKILRLLRLSLFERRSLIDLLKPPNRQTTVSPQLLLWRQL